MDRECEYTNPAPARLALKGDTEDGEVRPSKLEDNVTRLLELVEGFGSHSQSKQVSWVGHPHSPALPCSSLQL